MSSRLDMLAFGPHPDDVEIRCGGLLLNLSRDGKALGIVDCTQGESGSRGTVSERMNEAEAGRVVLGVEMRENLKLPDGFVSTGREEKEAMIGALRRHRPLAVLAPYPEDHHPDHAAVGQLVRDCVFLSGLRKIGDLEPHRPLSLFYYMCHQPFVPTFVVDVTEVFSRKLEAIQCYRSQLHQPGIDAPKTDIGSADYLERVKGNHRYFGSMIGVRYGEPYFAPRPFQLDDPVSSLLSRSVN